MKQLHRSYSNLGSWREVRDPASGAIHFQFDPMQGIVTSILAIILCTLAAIGLSHLKSNSGNDGPRIVGIWIISATGLLTSLAIAAHGMRERRKGDVLRYRPDKDLMELPRTGQSIENARQRVSFSSEHYTDDDGDHFFELNIVLDGTRIPFLSSISANGFRSITRPLEALGFAVNHQRIKIG